MPSSNSKPFLIIFAVIAIVAAVFALKYELSNVNKSDQEIADAAAAEAPDRMLVESPNGRIPEAIPDWFKRVGYQKLGFDSQQQLNEAQKMMTAGRRDDKTPEQLALIHTMLQKKDPPFPHQMAVSLLPGLQGTDARKQFLPDVRALFDGNGPNQHFRTIVTSWYSSGDKDLVKTLENDPDKKLVAEVKKIENNVDFPGKGV